MPRRTTTPARQPTDTTQPAPDLPDGILAEGSDTHSPTTTAGGATASPSTATPSSTTRPTRTPGGT
jgi:hypothetical protein